MPPLPGMMIWTDSFLADVATLTTEEIGAHMMLRVAAWRAKDGRLPDDDRHLARVCRASPRVWARLRPVLANLWVVEGGFWSNEALDHERKRATAVSQTRSTAAHAKHRKTKETGDAYAPSLHMHLDIEEDKTLESLTLETPTEPEQQPSLAVGKPAGRYAWQGQVIRLTPKDLDRWRAAAPDVDLQAYLFKRDLWLADLDPDDPRRKKWFVGTGTDLANHQIRMAAEKRDRPPPKPTPQDIAARRRAENAERDKWETIAEKELKLHPITEEYQAFVAQHMMEWVNEQRRSA